MSANLWESQGCEMRRRCSFPSDSATSLFALTPHLTREKLPLTSVTLWPCPPVLGVSQARGLRDGTTPRQSKRTAARGNSVSKADAVSVLQRNVRAPHGQACVRPSSLVGVHSVLSARSFALRSVLPGPGSKPARRCGLPLSGTYSVRLCERVHVLWVRGDIVYTHVDQRG